MTDKPTPKEMDDLFVEETGFDIDDFPAAIFGFARAVLAKWGQPAQAAEPVAPDFYTACAWHEGGGEAGWIPLPGHSNETENGVKHLVLEAARKEGYKGTVAGRLFALGWEIRPVYLTPQPTQAQPVARVPLDEARLLFDAGWRAAALFCDREDVAADGIIGFGACPQFEAAFSAALKGGQHG